MIILLIKVIQYIQRYGIFLFNLLSARSCSYSATIWLHGESQALRKNNVGKGNTMLLET